VRRAGKISRRFSREFLEEFYGNVRTFVFTAGKRVKNEFFLPKRLHISNQKMMDDSVPKIGRENFPRFGLGNDKTNGSSRLIRMILELLFQLQQFAFKIHLNFSGVYGTALPFPALIIGGEKFPKSKKIAF
jgi:hypothetical protein